MTSPSPWPSPRDAYRLYLDSAAAAAVSTSAASLVDGGPPLITAPAPPAVPPVLSTPRSAPGTAIPLFTESSPSAASTDDMLAQCIADTRQLLSELIRAAGTGNHVAQAAILPASELLGFQIAAQRSHAHLSLDSSAQARNPAMIAAPSLHSANAVADDQCKLRLQLAKRQRESALFRSVLASPSPPQVLHAHASLVSRHLPPPLSLAPTVAHLPAIPDTVCDTSRRSTTAPNPKSPGRTRRMSCGAGRRLFPPPLMPRPDSPDPITSDTPPTSNPHVIPPTFSTYQVSPSRYTSAGRLALHSSSPGAEPSLVLAHLLVPARHIPKRVLDQYCECIQSLHSASPNMTRVLCAIVRAGPLLSQLADQVASMVKRKWLTGLRALNHLVAWTLKPMVAVCVQPVAESKWADGLFAHLLDADREYAERMRAQVVVAVGVECDEHPDGLFADSRVPNRDTSGFRLRERVALVVGEVAIPAGIEYFSGDEQHDDMDVDSEMGKVRCIPISFHLLVRCFRLPLPSPAHCSITVGLVTPTATSAQTWHIEPAITHRFRRARHSSLCAPSAPP
ncbi:hypothetical protein BCR44DRAFT_354630 [Catenaria anguillulae PL171]|uniref:Uncharacterized protein n=1 Tax=Catenaria anguillulae PL171 TaxID=765915 RepID=A0A1Y2HDF6_9FUNG|nr:hypothetical protein BCR44DRAFT_354630 [Catenaria anguillulae PL171]